MVNNGYSIINRAMFDALQAIAKLSPQVVSHSIDPEDKEQLNYHIMMIENMNHYVEEVDSSRGGRAADKSCVATISHGRMWANIF